MVRILQIEQSLKRRCKYLSIGFLYAIIVLWFLYNGEGSIPGWTSSNTFATILYLVGVSVFIGINEKLPPELKSPFWESLLGFSVGVIITWMVCNALYGLGLWFTGVTAMDPDFIVVTWVYQLAVVAVSEEIIFRDVIFRTLYRVNPLVGYLGSSALFGVFHFAAYGGNWTFMFVAFTMGLILAYCTDRWNIGVAISVHFVYNICALGAGIILTVMVV